MPLKSLNNWDPRNLSVMTTPLVRISKFVLLHLDTFWNTRFIATKQYFLHYGSKQKTFFFIKLARNPLLITTDPSQFINIFPNYLNILFMSIFHFTYTLKEIPSTVVTVTKSSITSLVIYFRSKAHWDCFQLQTPVSFSAFQQTICFFTS
jgi:hypothetical protein